MSSRLAARLVLAAVVAGVLPACGNVNDGHAAAPFTVLASISTDGALANRVIFRPRISGDGRFVVFATQSTSLVPAIVSGFFDVFRRNLETGVTELVSIGVGGVPADGDSENPSISQDGRWVAFESAATNLTAASPSSRQVFLRDMDAIVGNGIVMVSESAPGVPGDDESIEPSVSADGRYVAFASLATTFGDTHLNGVHNIYRRDMTDTTIILISANTTGDDPTPDIEGSRSPSISADGSRIAYVSDCSDLVASDTNGLRDVFVTTVGPPMTNTLASVGPLGEGGGGESYEPALSGDGRFVTFTSDAEDHVLTDANLAPDIFVFDVDGGAIELVSVNEAGFQGTNSEDSHFPSISFDGRYIAFESFVPNFIADDTNQAVDIFVKDTVTGAVTRVSVDTSGQPSGPNQNSVQPSLSADARAVAFLSFGTFVNNDLNGLLDAYVRSPLR